MLFMLNIDSPNEQSFFTKFGGKIKFSTFYQLVKETKELSSYQEEIPESFQKFQSLCEKCENFELLTGGIKKCYAQFLSLPTLTQDILKLCCCHLENEQCINKTCSDCPNVKMSGLNETDEVLFYQ